MTCFNVHRVCRKGKGRKAKERLTEASRGRSVLLSAEPGNEGNLEAFDQNLNANNGSGLLGDVTARRSLDKGIEAFMKRSLAAELQSIYVEYVRDESRNKTLDVS